jgi:deoxyribonuclease-4
MRFGFHISIAGGFSKVVERAERLNCQTIQLFARNPRGWDSPPLDRKEVEKFKKSLSASKIHPLFVHLPYLPNLASPKFYKNSLKVLIEDLKRTETLGGNFLILHSGHRLANSEEKAIKSLSQGINEALARVENKVGLLLENSAGQGTEIGCDFLQIRKIIEKIESKERVGVCLDTAHLFEFGYDISKKEGLAGTLKEFESLIGLEKLFLLHLNDSKTPLGSRKDRHWHIGKGCIGLEGFRNIVNHPLLKNLPGIMETPRKSDADDPGNMQVIRSIEKIK